MPSTHEYQISTSKLLPATAIPETTLRLIVLVSCGSFNPVHCAHVKMLHEAKVAIESQQPGSLVVGAYMSPVNDAYKKEGLASFPKRCQIVEAMLKDDPLISLDCWEGLQAEYVRTYYVLAHVHSDVARWYDSNSVRVPLHVAFVCGADLFETFYRSNCWQLSLLRKIFEEFQLIVASRSGSADPRDVIRSSSEPITSVKEPGESLDLRPFADSVVVFQLQSNVVSSTLIREMARRGETIPSDMISAAALPLVLETYGPVL